MGNRPLDPILCGKILGGGGGGGGSVSSVNGKTGAVVLGAEDVGAMPSAAIDALLALLSKVAYIDDDGQQYVDDLEDALYNRTLSSISALFTQGSAAIYPSDSLDDLRQYLVVTAVYSDSTTKTITDYTLSGTLVEGTSTITAAYRDKTDTFDVIVSAGHATGYTAFGDPTIVNNILTTAAGKGVRSNVALDPGSSAWKVRTAIRFSALPTEFKNLIGGADASGAFAKTFVMQTGRDKNANLYVSADKSNWGLSNKYTNVDTFTQANVWYYIETGYDGTKYFTNVYTDGWDGTMVGTIESTSSVHIYGGEYIGFAPTTGSTNPFDGDINLAECSLYVDDSLVWKAV